MRRLPIDVPYYAGIFLLVLVWVMPSQAGAQTTMLDDFETFAGWKPIVSEGAHLTLASGPGKVGKGLEMDFDLSGVYGYVIAQKDFHLDLPANYEFTFDLSAEAPVNNFEFKLFDDNDNVYWIKKLNVTYPRMWTYQRIKKRHITFAWGPSKGGEIRTLRKVEFVVSVGTGGRGRVFIDNLRFQPIDDSAAARAHARVVNPGSGAIIDPLGKILQHWKSGSAIDSLIVDFQYQREVGGLVIDWNGSAFATAYDAMVSDDGREWTSVYRVGHGNGGRDYLYTHEAEGRYLKLLFTRTGANAGYAISRMVIKDPAFSSSPNEFFRELAVESHLGMFPKYFLNKQSYWTVLGVDGDGKEALMNEQGQIEVDKQQFMLEPFLVVDGKLITWSNVTTTPDLYGGRLPLPSVEWNYQDRYTLLVEGCAAGVPGNCLLGVRYTLRCKTANSAAKLFVAIRPFQVNPPWQALNVQGGATRIDSITYEDGMVRVNAVTIIPMTPPSGFGAAEFDQGHITEFIAKGMLPESTALRDHFGYASAALMYDMQLQAGQTAQVVLAVPFYSWRGSPTPNMGGGGASTYFTLMHAETANLWSRKLNTFQLQLPPSAGGIENTLKANLGYILVNRDGPGIQPGSRSYDRSWIRDGSLTCAALLRTGHAKEVREFIDWYAKGQFPSGKIPCVIDSRGPDAVPEHDSHGEFIYAVLQYHLFTKDTAWLRGKYDAVTRTIRYVQSLRADRKTERYRNGTPEERARYGLVPESISHEGYWDVPRHSYWDDFFILRGLKDATTIAQVLGDREREREFAAERDDFRKDLYASVRLAMQNTKVDYIPGCAELGDFDATSTTIGVVPGGELGFIPEPQLHNTFERYYQFMVDREKNNVYENYTPYETRTIGTFVHLGQKDRAEVALKFFMKDRRPPEWNQWAEVVWRDRDTCRFIGDMPHTWVGSDFIRSVLSMFLYERERDTAVVLAAGIPDSWIWDSAGVSVEQMRTYGGTVSYSIRSAGQRVTVNVSGSLALPPEKLVLMSPLSKPPRTVRIDGKRAPLVRRTEVEIRKLPTRVEFTY